MTCIKTGFHARLIPHNIYLYGDAYRLDQGVVKSTPTYIFRICEMSGEPIAARKHFDLHSYEHWFDERHTSTERNSTMICLDEQVEDLGYEGVPT